MRTREIKTAVNKAIKALPEKVTLTYIDYRDSLDAEQLAKVLGGLEDEVMESFSENNRDSEDDSVSVLLEEALPSLDGNDLQQIKDSDEYDRFREECYDRDDSTPLADLLKNCNRRMVRFYLDGGKDELEMAPDSYRFDEDQCRSEKQKLATMTGLDLLVNDMAFSSLIDNASYGGRVCVLAYVEVADLYKAVNHLLRDNEARVRMTFTDPDVLIYDGMNGSGHDEQVKGDITLEFGFADLGVNGIFRLDEKGAGTGYSWSEDIAGTVNSAFKQDPKIELLPAPAAVTV